jgi:hypothetical protein
MVDDSTLSDESTLPVDTEIDSESELGGDLGEDLLDAEEDLDLSGDPADWN